ncbi:hypothetical protein GYA19_01855, partial [Candidatus Beckwithbacteria bacterium]|nr:hypothetical protein [Candidatus Beckwithbacteria bacterium]
HFKGDFGAAIMAGASATGFAISDKDGKIVAIFTACKPSLVLQEDLLNNNVSDLIASFGQKPGEIKSDRVLKKLNTLLIHYDEIQKAFISAGVNFPKKEDIYIEPLLTALLRSALDLPLGCGLGISPDDLRGITGGLEDKDLAKDILLAFDLREDQFFIQSDRVLKIGEILTGTYGDFQVNERIIDQLKKQRVINPGKEILVELDSVMKVIFDLIYDQKDSIVATTDTLKEKDPLARLKPLKENLYSTGTGARVNPEILFKLWASELVTTADKQKYKEIDNLVDLESLKNNQNPYFYLPNAGGSNGTPGIILKRDLDGNLRKISLQEIITNSNNEFSKEEKKKITAAVFAGLGCELRKVFGENLQGLVLYGGLIQKDQPNKLLALVGCLPSGVVVDTLELPNPGVGGAILTLQEEFKRVNFKHLIKRENVSSVGCFNDYYEAWEKVYDVIISR